MPQCIKDPTGAWGRRPQARYQPSTYLRKSEYLTVGAEGKATAFLHSNGAAFSLYTSTKASIACRS